MPSYTCNINTTRRPIITYSLYILFCHWLLLLARRLLEMVRWLVEYVPRHIMYSKARCLIFTVEKWNCNLCHSLKCMAPFETLKAIISTVYYCKLLICLLRSMSTAYLLSLYTRLFTPFVRSYILLSFSLLRFFWPYHGSHWQMSVELHFNKNVIFDECIWLCQAALCDL